MWRFWRRGSIGLLGIEGRARMVEVDFDKFQICFGIGTHPPSFVNEAYIDRRRHPIVSELVLTFCLVVFVVDV